MGLLDEAIREHLELKRRSGADPIVVARAESEALAPVPTDDDSLGGDGEDWAPELSSDDNAERAAPFDSQPVADARLTEFSSVGQETAELDMRAVMEEDLDNADPVSPVGPFAAAPTPATYDDEAPAEDSFEWEVPGREDSEAAPENIPGQERLSFD